MNELDLFTTKDTMSSAELSDMLGFTKSELHRKIKERFTPEIDDGEIPSSLDNRGYVIQYDLPEVICKMLVAMIDKTYLRVVTEWFISSRSKPLSLRDSALRSMELSRIQLELVDKLEAVTEEKEVLEIKLDVQMDWASTKSMSSLHGRSFAWLALKHYCKDNGLDIKPAFDRNYGNVNTYPMEAWKAVYGVTRDV